MAARRLAIEAARSEELRASRGRIVAAADAARRRIERDLHDGAQQRLIALALQAKIAQARFAQDPASAGPFLDQLGEQPAETSAELRELARGIHRPCPPSAASARRSRRSRRARRCRWSSWRCRAAAAQRRRDDGLLHRRRGADQRSAM